MSYRVASLIFGGLLTLAAGPIYAQASPPQGVIPPGQGARPTSTTLQRDYDSARMSAGARAMSDMRKNSVAIAKCIARRGGNRAGSYVGGGLAGDPDYQRIGEALTGRLQGCAQGQEVATAITISGALAEELVHAQAPQLADRATAVNDDDAHRFFGNLVGAVSLDNIAGCLAVYSPGLVNKLLATESGSAEEAAALAQVYGQTPECQMSAPPSSVSTLHQRGALATALYKWTNRTPEA